MTRDGAQPPLWGPDGPGSAPEDGPPDAGRYRAGCPRCEATGCPLRRHNRRDEFWSTCWHEFDRADAHALGDHRFCLPGDAAPLPDSDPHEDHGEDGDTADSCRWAARWRAAALALADTLPPDRPLGVVLLDPDTGPRPLSSHASYRTAGPARTRAGRRDTDVMTGAAKARAVVICRMGHLH